MAQWRPTSYKTENVITNLGDGVNNGTPALSIKDSEMTYLRGMDSKDYPAISVRPGRSRLHNLQSTSVYGYWAYLNQTEIIVNGSSWETAGTRIAIYNGLATTYGNFAEIDLGTKYSIVYMNSTNKVVWELTYGGNTTTYVISDTNCPGTKILTAHKSRIYAAKNRTLHFSALNLTTDWTTAGDAGSITVSNAKNSITALVSYGGNLIIFTDSSMHLLYGSGPSSYEIVDLDTGVGCISHRAITVCKGKLYWIGRNGIYEYSGALPVRVSDKVKSHIESMYVSAAGADSISEQYAAGSAEDRYAYFSIAVNASTNNNIVLKYDVESKQWFVEDGNIWHLKTIGNNLHGIDYDGRILKMRVSTAVADNLTTDSATVPISWSFITKPFTEGAAGRDKVLSELNVVASISTASTAFSVGYSTNIENNDSTSFTSLFSTNAGSSNAQMRRIQVPATQLQNVPWYRLRFAGSGPATVNSLEKNLRVKRR